MHYFLLVLVLSNVAHAWCTEKPRDAARRALPWSPFLPMNTRLSLAHTLLISAQSHAINQINGDHVRKLGVSPGKRRAGNVEESELTPRQAP